MRSTVVGSFPVELKEPSSVKDKILNLFAENRKLSLIIITETGSLLEQPIGVIAIGDIMDVNKHLSYSK